MRPILDAARDLALAHRTQDPTTSTIKYFPNGTEIHLVEVSSSAPTTGEVIPFRYASAVEYGVDYPSVVVLLSPDEWLEIQNGVLSLPEGWDMLMAEDI